jgi:hypothetical protein
MENNPLQRQFLFCSRTEVGQYGKDFRDAGIA